MNDAALTERVPQSHGTRADDAHGGQGSEKVNGFSIIINTGLRSPREAAVAENRKCSMHCHVDSLIVLSNLIEGEKNKNKNRQTDLLQEIQV